MPPIHDTPLAVKPPHREILTDSVYEAVKALVMDRRIAPGARINIDRLARDLHVSPTPIREALARLESDGLVTKEALRGYSVAGLLDLPSFLQLYEMRLLLEPAAARKAAEVMTKEDLRAMGQQVATMQQARIGETYEEYRLFAAEDARFHDTIARAPLSPAFPGRHRGRDRRRAPHDPGSAAARQRRRRSCGDDRAHRAIATAAVYSSHRRTLSA
jgi:DNA-binding GntR family transcriptional regulator